MDGSHNIGGMPPIDYTGLQWLGHIISEGCHRPGYSGNNIVWSIWHNKFYTAFSDSMFKRAGLQDCMPTMPWSLQWLSLQCHSLRWPIYGRYRPWPISTEGLYMGPVPLPYLWRPTHHHVLLMAQNDNPDLVWDKLVPAMKMAAPGITIGFGSLWPDCLTAPCRFDSGSGISCYCLRSRCIRLYRVSCQIVSSNVSSDVSSIALSCAQPLSDENFPIKASSS